MLQVEIAQLIHQFGMILVYAIIFAIIWIIATIVNNIHWHKNISMYAAQKVQAQLNEQEQTIKEQHKALKESQAHIEELESKLAHYKGLFTKLNSDTVRMMELLNNATSREA